MKRLLWDATKIFVIILICTLLFYYSLQLMQAEYEQIHRYDPPEGPSIKVFK